MPGQNFRGFAERVALVVGGARGVGRAVALQLALEGAYVIVSHAPEDAEGARVLRELREMGTLAHAVGGEASRAEGVGAIFRAVEESFGRLDLLVNAGGVLSEAPLSDLTEGEWDEVLAATLRSAFLCSRAAAGLMSKRPAPAIVNVASEAGLTGAFGGVAGVAAHAGLVGLTKALARELAPRVRVNCVAVGASPPAPDEAARAAVYLLSPKAGSVTGQTLTVGAR
ncbi:MAG TPA: SDR family NAD(P)-dependent oxidoreductase [Pyrinomonadaceae bacterium]|nr:SDR family NAD(P)-dependent oxidoreductase [Pyrinomonadaceae bacterium]